MPILLDLSSSHGITKMGGKGERLNRIASVGLKVPSAFVLTFEAQALTLDFNGLQREPLLSFAVQEGTLLRWANHQRETIRAGSCPGEVRDAISHSLAELKGHVAVRSSGGMEDGAYGSWAGMFDTILYSQRETIEVDVLAVWASNYSDSSVVYRLTHGVATEPAAWTMAVIIERMVKPILSGVLLTRDPRPGRDSWMVTEVVSGMGSELVSGRTNPQRYLLHRQTGLVRREDCQSEQLPASFRLGGSSSDCFQELHRSGLKIEALLNAPANIEWCWDASTIWFLQARPFCPNSARNLAKPDLGEKVRTI